MMWLDKIGHVDRVQHRLIFAQHGLPEEVVSDNGP